MTHRRAKRQAFTLIELAIAVAVIGIVSVAGWGQVNNLLPRYRTRQAAMDFASAVDDARVKAVMDNREYRIFMVMYDASMTSPGDNNGAYWIAVGDSASGSTNWDVLPRDEGGSDDRQAEGQVDIGKGGADFIPDVSIGPWANIDGPRVSSGGWLPSSWTPIVARSRSGSNQDCIVFSPRGWVMNPNSDFAYNGYIAIEFVNKEAAILGRDEVYRVSIARSGFARVDYSTVGLYRTVEENSIGLDGVSNVSNASSTDVAAD